MKLTNLFLMAATSILLTNAIHAQDPEKMPETFQCCKENDNSIAIRNKVRWFKKHSCAMNRGHLQKFGPETQDSLLINGGAKLDGTTVTNQVAVNGVLVGVKATIGSIQANGKVSLFGTTVQNGVDVNGFFVAKNSTFQGPLTFSSDKIYISGSTADTIFIRQTGNANQVIILANGTFVGSVEFESGNGTIIQKGPDVTVGSVIGATVIVKD